MAKTGRPPVPAIDRFLSKVAKPPELGGCWIWQGSVSTNGYGQFYWNEKGKCIRAHRAAHLLFKGDLTEGLTLDHLCRNIVCVNPEHLEEVSARENILRGEGVCANLARRDTCSKGHPFNADTTSTTSGWRCCLICSREKNRKKYYARKARLAGGKP